MNIYNSLLEARRQNRKKLGILIDPDHTRLTNLHKIAEIGRMAGIDYFFVGGSLLVDNRLEECLRFLRGECDIPLVLFPGSLYQVSPSADAILFLSLISGRNPELLIGKHVISAPYIRKSGLEVIPTGYMLVDGSRPSTASYMTNTQPIPADNAEIASCTAMAGEMLGLRTIYLDAGSGAGRAVSPELISAVRQNVDIPLIVGGGINSPRMAAERARAGADLLVVGNAVEKDPELIFSLSDALHSEKLITGS